MLKPKACDGFTSKLWCFEWLCSDISWYGLCLIKTTILQSYSINDKARNEQFYSDLLPYTMAIAIADEIQWRCYCMMNEMYDFDGWEDIRFFLHSRLRPCIGHYYGAFCVCEAYGAWNLTSWVLTSYYACHWKLYIRFNFPMGFLLEF